MIITRFPPSPTGDLHIGGARTALYNWLIARQANGKMILRVEDTDTEREKAGAIDGILAGMQWLGLDYDEGPYYQTQRYDRYAEVVQQLLEAGKAYYCFHSKEELDAVREQQMANKEKPKAPRTYRDMPLAEALEKIPSAEQPPVVRFKTPLDGTVSWNDLVHGDITFPNAELDDLIIARPDGSPTYNFCVVVDDIDMQMTHVVRGDDHINNTARQIHIFEALGADVPAFGHVPMILGDDGKKLSKRHGAASVLAFRDAGYLPHAVKNYLVRLGWSHGDQEIFSEAEMLELFDITTVNKAASAFNTEKLNWLNQHYMKAAPAAELVAPLAHQYALLGVDTGDADLAAIIPYYVERAKTLKEMAEQTTWLFQTPSEYPAKAAKKAFHANAGQFLQAVADKLTALDDWQQAPLHDVVAQVVAEHDVGFGKVGMPLRLALTGGAPSPNIDEIMLLLGREKTLQAITAALAHLQSQ
ncbi:MAG: glutamate--tRNA ligase [Gammaproteobacteria bacterium]|nr:MAG: glutamate--tRNA ligase [Gammaproteobacteria bacterium]